MTNEDLLNKTSKRPRILAPKPKSIHIDRVTAAMDLARKDEREKFIPHLQRSVAFGLMLLKDKIIPRSLYNEMIAPAEKLLKTLSK